MKETSEGREWKPVVFLACVDKLCVDANNFNEILWGKSFVQILRQ